MKAVYLPLSKEPTCKDPATFAKDRVDSGLATDLEERVEGEPAPDRGDGMDDGSQALESFDLGLTHVLCDEHHHGGLPRRL
jgi:hypothetical protein